MVELAGAHCPLSLPRILKVMTLFFNGFSYTGLSSWLQEVSVEISQVHDLSGLETEFKAILGHLVRLSLKIKSEDRVWGLAV